MRVISVCCMLAMCFVVAACADKSTPVSKSATLPPNLFLTSEPAGAHSVKDAKAGAKVGDQVAVVGRIGGSKEPFVDGRAMFTIVDLDVAPCGDELHMPDCDTPWDYCCEPRDQLTANMATVRVIGSNGKPLEGNVKDVQGIQHLAKVVVVGTVSQADGGNLVVDASGLYVMK